MARKRMIDPNIWQSEDFSKLSHLAKVVFIGMFSNADDEGRGRAKSVYLKSILFPYDDGMRIIDIDKALSEIGSNMSVTFYAHDGSQYYELENWHKWQTIDRPQRSIIPGPDDIVQVFDDQSTNDRRTLDDQSLLKEKKRKEREYVQKGFEIFWEVWPRKQSKANAKNAWIHLNPDKGLLDDILTGIDRSKKYDFRFRESQYTPLPATWINAKGWLDEFDSSKDKRREYELGSLDETPI